MPQPLKDTNLYKPLTIGNNVQLQHRVVMPPLTRDRNQPDTQVPVDLMLQYYDERSKTPGTLIIVEATFVSQRASGRRHAPGAWSDAQLAAWKQIIDKIHANGSYASLQLWNLGRQAEVGDLTKHKVPFKSASDGVYLSKESELQANELRNPLTGLTKDEIKQYVEEYATTAEKAVKVAGFDIVEIHGAHGYLFDQFFQTVTNKRTDEYGGSIENRARFFFEVLDAVISTIGSNRVAARISPWATFAGMAGAKGDPHPYAQFGYIFSELQKRHAKSIEDNNGGLAYLSIVEPRVSAGYTVREENIQGNNEWIFEIFKGPILRTGSYADKYNPGNYSALIRDVNKNDRTLIGIGRPFISNPDLVERLRNGWDLTPYDRSTFYIHTNLGYNTYPTYGENDRTTPEDKDRIGKPLA